MLNNESLLLEYAMVYANACKKQIRLVLTSYSLTHIICSEENIPLDSQHIIQGTVILDNIIRIRFNNRYTNLSETDKKESVQLADSLLTLCSYVPSYKAKIIALVTHSHNDSSRKTAQQIITEAALLAACFETGDNLQKDKGVTAKFRTKTGYTLLTYLFENKTDKLSDILQTINDK